MQRCAPQQAHAREADLLEALGEEGQAGVKGGRAHVKQVPAQRQARQAAAIKCCTVPPCRKQLRQAQQTERGPHFLPGYLASSRLDGHVLIKSWDLSSMFTCASKRAQDAPNLRHGGGQAHSTTAYRRALATHGVRVPQVSYEGLDRHCYGSAAATCAALSIRAKARDATTSSRVRCWHGAHPGRRSGRQAVRTRLRRSWPRRTRSELRPARGCRCRPRQSC